MIIWCYIFFIYTLLSQVYTAFTVGLFVGGFVKLEEIDNDPKITLTFFITWFLCGFSFVSAISLKGYVSRAIEFGRRFQGEYDPEIDYNGNSNIHELQNKQINELD